MISEGEGAMRKLASGLVLAAWVGLVGCSGHTSTKPGGGTAPGATSTPGDKAHEFKVKAQDVSIKQGDSGTVKISVSRGSEQKDTITVSFKSTDKDADKIKIDPASFIFKPSESDTHEFK